MCGICGFTGAKSQDFPILKRMCDIMAHRGPDGEGQYIDEGIALGHRRLSLIDLAGGNQPMVRATGAHQAAVTSPAAEGQQAYTRGRHAIVFNGEIYNYRDLKAELEAMGWSFQTNTDTEVLLVSYLEWGKSMFKKVRGMFAFAIWDGKTRELFCARDFFGIKPFYYTQVAGHFIFASRSSRCRAPLYIREQTEALEQYPQLPVFGAARGLFQGIFKLAPGRCLTVHADGGVDDDEYWKVDYAIDPNLTVSRYRAHPCRRAGFRALPPRGRRGGGQLPELRRGLELPDRQPERPGLGHQTFTVGWEPPTAKYARSAFAKRPATAWALRTSAT